MITPAASGHDSVTAALDVLDAVVDLNAVIQVTVNAARMDEAFGFASMTVTRSDAIGDVDVTVTSSDTTEAIPFGTGPYRISNGSTFTTVFVQAQDDTIADCTQTAILTATTYGQPRE